MAGAVGGAGSLQGFGRQMGREAQAVVCHRRPQVKCHSSHVPTRDCVSCCLGVPGETTNSRSARRACVRLVCPGSLDEKKFPPLPGVRFTSRRVVVAMEDPPDKSIQLCAITPPRSLIGPEEDTGDVFVSSVAGGPPTHVLEWPALHRCNVGVNSPLVARSGCR